MADDDTQPEGEPAEPPRYDLLCISQNRAYNVVEQGLKSLLNFLSATGYVRVYAESVAEEWTEVYSHVGPSSHELFVKGAYSGPGPVFLELAVRGGIRPIYIPYGPPTEETCYFYVEVRGALFNDLTGMFKKKLKDVMATRFDFYVRDHVALPPHAVVPPGEEPIDKKKKKDGAPTRVGTDVEEY